MVELYFFDSYALIEIAKGNENYKPYKSEPVFTSIFQLYEFSYSVVSSEGEEKASGEIKKVNANLIEVTEKDIIAASKFRFDKRKQKLSYADCIGYVLAKKHGIKFLTGDKEFRNLGNVEFVK
ncbi:MAG: PIN domain-containing protein [Candidatus Diapherotrites archaeon]